MPTVSIPSRRVGFLATSAVCLLLLASTAAPGVPPPAVTPTAAIDALLKGSFPADRPGAAVIVVKDGRTLFRKAYGMANLELGRPAAAGHGLPPRLDHEAVHRRRDPACWPRRGSSRCRTRSRSTSRATPPRGT